MPIHFHPPFLGRVILTFGAYTAAEEGAKYFWNVVKEDSASPRSLVIHEVMGRNCGWLTAFTGIYYRRMFKSKKANLVPSFGHSIKEPSALRAGFLR